MGLKAVATLVPGGGAPVGGSGTIGKLPKWATTSTLNDSVIAQSGANIGIGTASPGAILHTLAPSSAPEAGIFASANANSWIVFRRSTSTLLGYIGTGGLAAGGAAADMTFRSETGGLLFATGATERMRIDATGNVAIGRTTTAGTIFETQGDIVSFRDAASNVRVRFEAANSLLNVGLGTTGWGLKLPATPGNADAQTLDCYQENPLATTSGNGWTPTLSAAATWGGTQPNVTYARYVRMGSMVFCEVKLTMGAGTMTSTYGLTTIDSPFTTSTYASHAAVPVAAPGVSGVGFQTGTTVYLPTIGASSTFILAWSFFA